MWTMDNRGLYPVRGKCEQGERDVIGMAVHNVSRCNTLPPMQNTMLLVVMGIGWTAPSLAGEPALEVEPLRTPRPVGKNLWRGQSGGCDGSQRHECRLFLGKTRTESQSVREQREIRRAGGRPQAGNCREGGVLVVESLVLRRQPSTTKLYRRLALVNFGTASVTGATAIRNLGIPRP